MSSNTRIALPRSSRRRVLSADHAASAKKAAGSAKKATIDYTAEALADEVTILPGLTDTINFRHFSGYLQISETKSIFYWYATPPRT